MFEAIWNHYDQEIVAAGLSLVVLAIAAIAQARVRLRWGTSHGFVHSVPMHTQEGQPTNHRQHVCTMSHLIANWGNKTAHQVEVTLNFPPLSCEIWPQRHYETLVNPEGKLIIRFPYLNPRTSVSLNVIHGGFEGPEILSVISEEGNGKQVPFTTARLFPQSILIGFLFLLFMGVVFTCYLLIRALGAIATLG